MPPVSVNIAVLSNADLAAAEVVAMESAVADRVTQAGHKIVAFSTVKNSEVAIRSELVGWLADPEIDVVIVVGEGDAVGRSLKPMIDQSLPGFPDLLRKLASEAIGKGALLSVAEAARCGTTFVFVLPGNEQAVAAAMDKVVLPQLDPRTKPRNLIAAMPRLRDAVTHDVTRVDVTKIESSRPSEQVITAVNNARLESARVASAKTDTEKTRVGIDVKKIEESRLDSVPTPVAFEKTESGAGPAPKLPAMPSGRAEPVKKDNGAPTRARSRTGANVIVRKVEDTTKPIDLERLEREIAASKDDDATKSAPAAPSIEHTRPTLKPLPSIIAKPIPAPVSIPDELDDDHTKPMDLSQPTRGPAKKLSEQTQTNITKPTEITKPMDLSRLPKLPPGADKTALDDDAIAPPPIARPTPVPTALAPEPQSEIGRIQLKQVPSRATPPPIVEIQAPQASDSAETNPAASTEPASRATPAPANVAGGASPATFAEALNAAASAGSTGPASRGISKGATSEGAATSRATPRPPSRNAGAGWTSIGSTDAAPASRSRGAGSASTGTTSSDETPTSRATPIPQQSRGVGSASTRAGSASPGTTSSDEAPTSRATPASTRPAASTGAVSTGAASRGAGSGSTGAASTGAASTGAASTGAASTDAWTAASTSAAASDEAPMSRATPPSTRPVASTGAATTGAASRGAGSGSTGAGSTGAASTDAWTAASTSAAASDEAPTSRATPPPHAGTPTPPARAATPTPPQRTVTPTPPPRATPPAGARVTTPATGVAREPLSTPPARPPARTRPPTPPPPLPGSFATSAARDELDTPAAREALDELDTPAAREALDAPELDADLVQELPANSSPSLAALTPASPWDKIQPAPSTSTASPTSPASSTSTSTSTSPASSISTSSTSTSTSPAAGAATSPAAMGAASASIASTSSPLSIADLPEPRSSASDLPRGSFVYPVAKPKSRAPLVVALLVMSAGIGGGAMYFLKRDAGGDQSAPGVKTENVAEIDAASVPVAQVEIDAAEAEPVIEMDAAVEEPVATQETPAKPPKKGREPKPPRDRGKRVVADATPPKQDPPKQDPPKQDPPKQDDGECGEVQCVLDKYSRPCCLKYKPAGGNFTPSVAADPEKLQKPQIKAGVDRMKPRVIACGEQFKGVKGTVKVSMSVDPDGNVSDVNVSTSPDDGLGSCVAEVMKKAKFAKTPGGGSFTYPFVF